MASASKTPNLNLPQWVGTEKPERTDFNAAFDAIDDVIDGGSTTPFVAMPYVGTAPIIESGSNIYGNYVKYADGTMICTKNVSIGSIVCTTASGGIFRSAGTTDLGSTASEFFAIPTVSINIVQAQGAYNVWQTSNVTASVTKNHFGNLQIASSTGTTITGLQVHLIAIGRWKA